MKTLGTIVLALTLALGGTAAADVTYYLDAVHGNDTLGNGSAGAPWQSRDRVLAVVTGGDTVVLASGNYGTFALTATAAGGWDLFDDWVTFIEAPGANARFELIRISYTGTPPPDPYQVGFFDAYLRFEGIHVLDGVECFGARHWALIDCLVERYGPWTGAFENTRKMAVYFRSGTDILIKGCEITRTGTAVEGRGHDIRVLNCHIHHGTHDGIRAKGWWHSLIEGNLIHSFDDGVTDEEADWSSHCDLIHLYIPLPGIEGMQNRDVIIRNNVLYDTENQIVVLMGCFESDLRNQDIVFENNILGPSRATLFNNLDPCDGLVIRNNTVVVFDQPRPFGRWELENYTLRINEDSTGVQIYNNILGTCMIKTGAELLVFDHNLIQVPPDDNPAGVDNTRTFARNTLVGVDPMFVDPGAFDGVLDPASPAINFGTRRLAPTPIWEEDIVGTPRDWRPDLGAWELPGQIPLRESPPPIHYDVKTTFVDDFADGHYRDVDPWLDGPRQQGMNWDRPDPVNSKFCVTPSDCFDGSNALVGPQGDNVSTRQAWLFSEQGANWADYDFTFDAVNNYITRGSGVMVLAQDRDNYYWLDISSSNGRLVRFIDGAAVELARDADIELPYHGLQVYKVSVRHGEGDITIAVDTHNDGTEDFSYTDTTPLAVARFTAGGIGFHLNGVANRYHGIHYDSIRVDVLARADLVVPGDCDSDDDVDLDDFVILKQNFGRSGVTAGAAEGDLDVDGDVDLDDLVVLKQNFGR